jgi:hypothetical protein
MWALRPSMLHRVGCFNRAMFVLDHRASPSAQARHGGRARLARDRQPMGHAVFKMG